MYNLAVICENGNGAPQNLGEGIKYYKETIRINPSYLESYNDMGYCYYQSENGINALECFKKNL